MPEIDKIHEEIGIFNDKMTDLVKELEIIYIQKQESLSKIEEELDNRSRKVVDSEQLLAQKTAILNDKESEMTKKEAIIQKKIANLEEKEIDLQKREEEFRKLKLRFEYEISETQRRLLEGITTNELEKKTLKDIRQRFSETERSLNDKYATLQKTMKEVKINI